MLRLKKVEVDEENREAYAQVVVAQEAAKKIQAGLNFQAKILQAQEVQAKQEAKELATEEWSYRMTQTTANNRTTATYYRVKPKNKLREEITADNYIKKEVR